MANRDVLYRYKGYQCAHCRRNVQEMVDRYGTFDRMFEFHHVDRTLKDANYESIITHVLSTTQLNEVDKCILLCRNCHGCIESVGQAAVLLLKAERAGRRAQQRVSGQVILDRKTRHLTFLTNERIRVRPYRVFLGSRKPQIFFGTELEDDELLVTFMSKLAQFRTIVVRALNKLELLRVEYLGENDMRITHDVRCPFFTSELRDDQAAKPVLWARNGLVLSQDGRVFTEGTITMNGTIPHSPARGRPK